MQTICGKTIQEWISIIPQLADIRQYRPCLWLNPYLAQAKAPLAAGPGFQDLREAEARLERFRPFLEAAFPETAASGGLIESPLVRLPKMQQQLANHYQQPLPGTLLLKCDNSLPISGSIKARGGIYEVLKHAEVLAGRGGLLQPGESTLRLASQEAKRFFSSHGVAVGSTGNLGLSIGIMAAKFGFRTTVHMSADARTWKKELLKSHGVQVVEHDGDFSQAVDQGRLQAQTDPSCHFIDDENSTDLFLGYAVAALRLKEQLAIQGIRVDQDHPLLVYLPCGVGGGPGGITFGLKQVFGEGVHCYFVEPTHSPCMLLGLATGQHEKVAVKDFGLDNRTQADGLAVGRPSGFVGRFLSNDIAGVLTVDDQELFRLLEMLAVSEGIEMEPSALAGLTGPPRLLAAGLPPLTKGVAPSRVTHLAWGTGGEMVPRDEMNHYRRLGRESLRNRP